MFNKKNKFYYKLLFSIFSLSIFSPIFIVSCSKKNDNNNNDDNNNNNVDDNLLIGDKELKQLIIDKKIEVALNQEINISLNYFNNYKSDKNEIIKMFRLKFNDSINQSSFKLEIEQEPVFNEKDNNTISCKFRITNLENSKYVIYDWKSSYFNFSTDENYFQEVYENISRSLYLKEEFQETRIIDLFEEKSTILNRDFINTYIDKQRALVNTVGIDYELEIPSQNLKMNLSNYFRFKLSLFDQKTKQKIVLKNTSVVPSLNVNENQKDTFTILNQDDFNQTPTSFITSDHLGKLFIRPKSKVVEEAVEINVRLQGKVIINELDLSYFKNLVFGPECDFKRNNITNVFFSEDATITNLNNEIFKNNLIKEINLPNKVINYSNNCFDKNVIINTKINSIESLDQILDFDNSSTNPNLMLNYLDSEQKLEEFLDFLTRSKITRTNLKFNKIYLPTKFKYSDNLLNNYRLNCSEVILPTVNEFTNRFSYWTVEKVHIPSSIIKINKNIFPQSTNVTREFNEEILKLIQNKELNLNSFNSSSDIGKLDDYFFSFNSNPLEIQKIIFSKDIIQNFSYSLSSDWKFFFDNNNILEKQIVFNELVQKINVDFYNSLKTKNINIERKIYSEFEKNGVISQKTLYLEKFYGINTDVTNFKDYLTGYESYIETINTQNVTTIKESTFDSLDWTNININLDQIQQIENRAFYSCDFLNTEINLENLVSIGDYAFYECNKIEQITLNNLTSIGNSAFYNCTQLRKIIIPKIKNLSSSAFSNCSNLIEINLENLVSIGDKAFYECNKIEQITLNNLTSIGNSTFYN
ncbi:MAG: leucine-rich repeat domain-containing protein, partial [Mycoplasmataceae bacterium]|nr:leucine-rich repeat domain-containing protein [Mycoplasmataceae bacterium]